MQELSPETVKGGTVDGESKTETGDRKTKAGEMETQMRDGRFEIEENQDQRIRIQDKRGSFAVC